MAVNKMNFGFRHGRNSVQISYASQFAKQLQAVLRLHGSLKTTVFFITVFLD